MHYYVVGVNGSGKTTLLKAINARTGIAYIHGTAVLMERLGIPGNYDKLRAFDQNYVLKKWGETALWLADERATDFLLDTHILNITKGRIIRRDGPWIGAFDALIQVTADPAIVLQRILNDTSKDRALFPAGMSKAGKLDLISDYAQETCKLFQALSQKYELPSLVIHNSGRLQDGVNSFLRFHRSLTS